jgi:imidazolonepropionase-like amidohydrolase
LTSYLFAGSGIGSPTNASSTAFEHRAIRGVNTAGEALELIADDSSGLFQTDFVRLTVEAPALGDSILVSAVDAAHQHGKLAVAYASTAESYRLAVKSGFDVITPVPNDAPLDAAVVAQLADAKVAVIPTLCFQKHKMDLEQIQAANGQTSRTQIAQALANVKTLHDAGVRICAGTSSNERGHMSIPFGVSLHEELQLLVEAGLSNREAIQSATSIPARVFGLRDRGSLEPGQHRADLVLVEGDPSEDITALSRIQRVWIEGIEVLRKV